MSESFEGGLNKEKKGLRTVKKIMIEDVARINHQNMFSLSISENKFRFFSLDCQNAMLHDKVIVRYTSKQRQRRLSKKARNFLDQNVTDESKLETVR